MTSPTATVANRVGPDVERIAVAVQGCPLVAALHGGPFGEVATYLPGRRVRGVRITADGLAVHVAGRYPASMVEIAAQVRAAVAPLADGLPIDVTIEDLVLPEEPVPGNPPLTSRPTAGARTASPAFPPAPTTPPHPETARGRARPEGASP